MALATAVALTQNHTPLCVLKKVAAVAEDWTVEDERQKGIWNSSVFKRTHTLARCYNDGVHLEESLRLLLGFFCALILWGAH
jgi:hypothetical protein